MAVSYSESESILGKTRPPREATALTALCARSKAHWGYDADFMRLSATALTIPPTMIEAGHVLVAEDRHASLVGVVAVQKMDCGDKFDFCLLYTSDAADE